MKANGTVPHDNQSIKMLCGAKYAFIIWLTNIICFKRNSITKIQRSLNY